MKHLISWLQDIRLISPLKVSQIDIYNRFQIRLHYHAPGVKGGKDEISCNSYVHSKTSPSPHHSAVPFCNPSPPWFQYVPNCFVQKTLFFLARSTSGSIKCRISSRKEKEIWFWFDFVHENVNLTYYAECEFDLKPNFTQASRFSRTVVGKVQIMASQFRSLRYDSP